MVCVCVREIEIEIKKGNCDLNVFFCLPGFNPLWDETFEFVVRFPELALIRFKVMDKDWGPNKDDFIASFALPFDSVVPG